MPKSPFSDKTVETRLPRPFNGSIYTTTRDIAKEKPAPEIGDTMEGELGTAWAASRIIAVNKAPKNPQSQLQIVHAIIPSVEAQLNTNWEWTSTDLGGRRYKGVSRTFIYHSSEFDEESPEQGTAMPIGSNLLFQDDDYILIDRAVVTSGTQLEPVFRVERSTYLKRCTIRSIGTDPLNGRPLTSRQYFYHKDEEITEGVTIADLFDDDNNDYWGTQDNGTDRNGQQLSCDWYSVTESQVIGGNFTAGVVEVDSYSTNDNFYWPPVLAALVLKDWERRDGGVDIYPTVRIKPEGYNGPCRTDVVRMWSKNPFIIPVVEQMLPTRINYGSPFFNLNIPECLHIAITAQSDIGNNDPHYKLNVGSAEIFPATNYTEWPESIIAYDDQQPYRGGYLRTTRTIYKPD